MTTAQTITTPSEGVNFNLTYTAYDQTAATSASNTPDNPGPPFSVGTIMNGTGDSQFIFVKASAAIAAGDTVLIDASSNATGITTTNATASGFGALVGVAAVAIASGAYGWVQRSGYCTPTGIRTATACGTYAQLATTATAGVLDDATTTLLVKINGIILTATNTSASTAATVGTLNYPVVGAAY